jgi:hypothetical protein
MAQILRPTYIFSHHLVKQIVIAPCGAPDAARIHVTWRHQMAIDAIVANMDQVWSAYEDDADKRRERYSALKQLVQRIHDDGYPLLLVSDLDAANLNSAISAALGEDGITYFSSILASQPRTDRYALALHTLETPAHRVMALGSSEQALQEARSFGIARCLHLNDVLHETSA